MNSDQTTPSTLGEATMDVVRTESNLGQTLARLLRAFNDDESGVAMTEYIIVFSAITFGSVLALIATTTFVKAYRDFLVWWLAHPAV